MEQDKCVHCQRPRHPRVYMNEKGVKIDETGVGGRAVLPGECNRRSAAGRVQCMEIELEFLRKLRTSQADRIRELHEQNQVFKKTVQELTRPELDEPPSGLIERIKHWTISTFGKQNWYSPRERMTRLLEETLELAQVCYIDLETIHKLVQRVYSREIGDLKQEATGVYFCLVAFIAGMELPLIIDEELKRLETTPPEVFRKKQQQKHLEGVALPPSPEPME